MNGKMVVFGWTLGGFAMIVCMYVLTQFMAFQSAFKL